MMFTISTNNIASSLSVYCSMVLSNVYDDTKTLKLLNNLVPASTYKILGVKGFKIKNFDYYVISNSILNKVYKNTNPADEISLYRFTKKEKETLKFLEGIDSSNVIFDSTILEQLETGKVLKTEDVLTLNSIDDINMFNSVLHGFSFKDSNPNQLYALYKYRKLNKNNTINKYNYARFVIHNII